MINDNKICKTKCIFHKIEITNPYSLVVPRYNLLDGTRLLFYFSHLYFMYNNGCVCSHQSYKYVTLRFVSFRL